LIIQKLCPLNPPLDHWKKQNLTFNKENSKNKRNREEKSLLITRGLKQVIPRKKYIGHEMVSHDKVLPGFVKAEKKFISLILEEKTKSARGNLEGFQRKKINFEQTLPNLTQRSFETENSVEKSEFNFSID